MADTVLTYRQHLWRNVTLVAALGLIISYVMYSANTVPHGGTLLGLLYGMFGLLVVLLLMFYGVRKRSYGIKKHSYGLARLYYTTVASGTLQAWLSFHIWLGLLTLLIIPLHAGFQFAFDVHTLAYALLVIVVISGIVGATLYWAVPRQFSHYGDELAQVSEHNIDSADDALNTLIEHMRALSAGKSASFVCATDAAITHGIPTQHVGWRLLLRRPPRPVAFISNEGIPLDERGDFDRLRDLAGHKRLLEYRLAGQMYLQNSLEVWLYIHLPVSIALMLAIAVHIFVVFYYGYRVP